jgi:peptidoglycan L-alanyl-D-glutamate endopeptidase CwlK
MSDILSKVHPELKNKVLKLIRLAKDDGYILTPTQGLRTFAEQDKLFRQRPRVTKAKGGQSNHNYGLAVDLGFVIDGEITWDEKYYKLIGKWADIVGLEWGGRWKFVDFPHVQLPKVPKWTTLLELHNKGGLPLVWSKFNTQSSEIKQEIQPRATQRLLKLDTQGNDVILLQVALIKKGFLKPNEQDGNFGQKTEHAVQQFQLSVGLKADGIVGEYTWEMLAK